MLSFQMYHTLAAEDRLLQVNEGQNGQRSGEQSCHFYFLQHSRLSLTSYTLKRLGLHNFKFY